jgi:hypothetical protein
VLWQVAAKKGSKNAQTNEPKKELFPCEKTKTDTFGLFNLGVLQVPEEAWPLAEVKYQGKWGYTVTASNGAAL